MRPVLKNKIIAIFTMGCLVVGIFYLSNNGAKLNINNKNTSNASYVNKNENRNFQHKLPISTMPKKKFTGEIKMRSSNKKIDDYQPYYG